MWAIYLGSVAFVIAGCGFLARRGIPEGLALIVLGVAIIWFTSPTNHEFKVERTWQTESMYISDLKTVASVGTSVAATGHKSSQHNAEDTYRILSSWALLLSSDTATTQRIQDIRSTIGQRALSALLPLNLSSEDVHALRLKFAAHVFNNHELTLTDDERSALTGLFDMNPSLTALANQALKILEVDSEFRRPAPASTPRSTEKGVAPTTAQIYGGR